MPSLTVSYYTVLDWYPYKACSFQTWNGGEGGLGRWEMGKGTGRTGERGNCDYFILCERIIKREIVDKKRKKTKI